SDIQAEEIEDSITQTKKFLVGILDKKTSEEQDKPLPLHYHFRRQDILEYLTPQIEIISERVLHKDLRLPRDKDKLTRYAGFERRLQRTRGGLPDEMEEIRKFIIFQLHDRIQAWEILQDSSRRIAAHEKFETRKTIWTKAQFEKAHRTAVASTLSDSLIHDPELKRYVKVMENAVDFS